MNDVQRVFILYKALGNRKISLGRELTKLNEEVMSMTLESAIAYYEENQPRGEYVLVVEGAPEGFVKKDGVDLLSLTVEEHVEHYISAGMSKKDAIKAVARDRGVPKNDIYMQFVEK